MTKTELLNRALYAVCDEETLEFGSHEMEEFVYDTAFTRKFLTAFKLAMVLISRLLDMDYELPEVPCTFSNDIRSYYYGGFLELEEIFRCFFIEVLERCGWEVVEYEYLEQLAADACAEEAGSEDESEEWEDYESRLETKIHEMLGDDAAFVPGIQEFLLDNVDYEMYNMTILICKNSRYAALEKYGKEHGLTHSSTYRKMERAYLLTQGREGFYESSLTEGAPDILSGTAYFVKFFLEYGDCAYQCDALELRPQQLLYAIELNMRMDEAEKEWGLVNAHDLTEELAKVS